MHPTEIARKMCEEIYGQGKIELIQQLVHDDAIAHEPSMGRTDRKGIEQIVQGYRRGFPDLEVKVTDTVAQGDKVVIRWRAAGTHRGDFFGVPASSQRVTIEGMSELLFQGGKIKESWDHYDMLGMMRQIGAIPESAMPARKPDGGARGAQPQPSSRR